YSVERQAAFEYVTDLRSWPDYWPNLLAVVDANEWGRPGGTARVRMRLAGRKVELRMILDDFRPPSLVRYVSIQPGLPDAEHERHFEPTGDGFRYRLVVRYRPRPGLAGVLDRTVIRWGIDRALRATLANLARQFAEARTHAR
ncbi:MAG TPA: SRPBCC family protein, partial [Jiangellales bacterium]|nr:SRPBCC family protein [Jiangellales bacterium]